MRATFIITLIAFPSIVLGQSMLQVSSLAWHGLTDGERDSIQSRYVVEAYAPESFGVIIDNQGADRSTPGTSAGANLGQAVADTAYIDRALDSGDYSAKVHLGAALIGGLLGSALDSKPRSNFQFRYTIRLGNGNIVYHDAYSKDPFRHSVGVCVALPSLSIMPAQHICSQTSESLRSAHLADGQDALGSDRNAPPVTSQETTDTANIQREIKVHTVSCKVGALPPVTTTETKCRIINGVVL